MGNYFNPDVCQSYSDTCAIKSQQLILNKFGIPCTEDQLVQFSYEKGWYNGNGTAFNDVGNLLESAGIDCSRRSNANVFDIVGELSQGHSIIVGVDSGELWDNDTLNGKFHNWLKDYFMGNTPDHALIVAGIDTSDPNDVKVIVTDPGTGDDGKPYPLSQFMDAWSDADCYMVSTNNPVPQDVPGMENFDMYIGHIDSVGGLEYPDFQIFNDLSNGIPIWQPLSDGSYCSPMSSLIDGYFDMADNQIRFADLLGNPDYIFNDYLSPQIMQESVFPTMVETYQEGLAFIPFTPENDWNHYSMVNGLDCFSNDDYSDFLSHSLYDFRTANFVQAEMYCEQQQMMMDLCNHFGFDFNNVFTI